MPKGLTQCIEPYGNLYSDAYQTFSSIELLYFSCMHGILLIVQIISGHVVKYFYSMTRKF